MDAVLTTLLEITIYSGIIYALMMLFKKLLREKLSPTLHFLIWFLLIARLCLPVTLESGIHFIQVPQEAAAQQAGEQAGANVPGVRQADAAGTAGGQADAGQEQPVTPLDVTDGEGSVPFTVTWQGALVFAWLAGIAGYGVCLTVAAHMNRNRLRALLCPAPAFVENDYPINS